MPERPHRLSRLCKVPETVEAVKREELEAVATMRPSRASLRSDSQRNDPGGFDLEAWIGEHSVPVKRVGVWGAGGRKYVLSECPWNGHRDNAAYIVQFEGGAIAAGCHHNSCRDYGWRELRTHYEPGFI